MKSRPHSTSVNVKEIHKTTAILKRKWSEKTLHICRFAFIPSALILNLERIGQGRNRETDRHKFTVEMTNGQGKTNTYSVIVFSSPHFSRSTVGVLTSWDLHVALTVDIENPPLPTLYSSTSYPSPSQKLEDADITARLKWWEAPNIWIKIPL